MVGRRTAAVALLLALLGVVSAQRQGSMDVQADGSLTFEAQAEEAAQQAHVELDEDVDEGPSAAEQAPAELEAGDGGGDDDDEHALQRRTKAAKAAATVPVCSKSGLKWTSENGEILLNGRPFHIKGTHWFGLETDQKVLHGLWGGGTTIPKLLDFVKANGFNALRVPVSLETVLNPNAKPNPKSCLTENCKGRKVSQILSQLFTECASRGIVILLDMHYLNTNFISELWYDDKHTEAQFVQGWVTLLKAYGAAPNLLGIDIKNEPHGKATWGVNDEDTDWGMAVKRIVEAALRAYPKYDKLVFVEGVDTGGSATTMAEGGPAWDRFWGSNLDGARTNPIVFEGAAAKLNEKIVYSPHIYGPGVYEHKYFQAKDFPNNMPAIWDAQVGWVEGVTGKAMILGEWGGRYTTNDKLLQNALAAYAKKNCIADGFWWALNPNSEWNDGKKKVEIGIMAKDWKTSNKEILKFLATAQPYPSAFTAPITAKKNCLVYGAYGNKGCDKGTGVARGLRSDGSP